MALAVASASDAVACDADRGADGDVLVDRIGGAVGVADGADVELVDVVHGDGEALGCSNEPSAEVARTVMVCVRRRSRGRSRRRPDDAVAVDREAATGIVVERVGDGVGGGIGVGRVGLDADRGADSDVLAGRIRGAVGIADRADIELVDVR